LIGNLIQAVTNLPGVRFLEFVSRLGYTAIADSRVLCLPFEFISIPIYFSLLTTKFT